MAWRHAVQWLLWVGLAGIILLIVGALSSPFWLQAYVERRASAMLSRPVAIGHLHLHTSGEVAVSAENVRISNPQGFPLQEEPLARVPRLTVQLDVRQSLQQRQIVIGSIELERPVVRAVATEDGQDNYHLTAAATPAASVRMLKILDGRAHVSLAAQQADFEVAFATEQTRDAAGATRMTAEARGRFAGQPLLAHVVVGVPFDSPSPRLPVEVDVQNGSTRVSAKGTLAEPLGLRSTTVSLQLAGPDMALLAPLTGVRFPATPPYELRGDLDYAAGVYRFTDASGRFGRSDVAGTLTVTARAEARPEITAELVSHSVALTDIESLLSGQPAAPGTLGETAQQHAQASRIEAEARASPRVFSQAPLHLPKLERADVHLTYRAERIQGAAQPFDNLALRMDLVDGAATLHPLSFGVGGGRISGDVWLTPQQGALRARATIQLNRLDIAHLMRASGFHGAGTLNGTAHLEGAGQSVAGILGNADGAMTLGMAGGDLSALLVDLAGLRLGSALLSSLGPSPNTRVACFVADLGLRQGILSTRTLLLKTEDAVTEGYGAIDLGREQVDVQLRTASQHLTIGVLPAPLVISGALTDLHVAPAVREGLVGALAMLPTIQPGIGDGPHCEDVLRRIGR